MLMMEQSEKKFTEKETTFLSYWETKEPKFIAYYRQEYSQRAGEYVYI